jgi:hypothetical protein
MPCAGHSGIFPQKPAAAKISLRPYGGFAGKAPRSGSSAALERINIENVHPLRKDLPANPCHGIVGGGLCPPVCDNFKVDML